VNILLVLHNLHTVMCMWARLLHARVHVCVDTQMQALVNTHMVFI